MNRIDTIPQDKTFYDILSEIGNTPCHCNEFIERNKFNLIEIGRMNDFDYEIFWGCMKVYEALGIDYFSNYADLRKGVYGNFSQGIEAWFNHSSIMEQRPSSDRFLEVVESLRFFKISGYHGIPFSEYQQKAEEAAALYQAATEKEMWQRQEANAQMIQQRVNNYFNFSDYSESTFEALSRDLIFRQEKSISINEALALARSAPHNTYIVILKKNDHVCHIGKTERPLFYIGAHQKKSNADSAHFEAVNPDYVDDLIISMRILYDVELDKIHPSVLNRKYATIKQATFAYKKSEGIPRKSVLSAIKGSKMRTVVLTNGQVLIDKIMLHKALYSSKNI